MSDSRLENILNLPATVTYQIIPPDTQEFEKHIDFLNNYQGRYRENYDRRHLEAFMDSHNRFNLGAVMLYVDQKLSKSFMIENYKNWLLISRFMSYEYPRLPIFTSMCYEPILEIARSHNFHGVFASINESNTFYAKCTENDFGHVTGGDSPIYTKHREIAKKIKKINSPIYFMRTQQTILYLPITGDIKDIFEV